MARKTKCRKFAVVMTQKETANSQNTFKMKQTPVSFTKMHGAGNDYIYVNTMLYDMPHPDETARLWSDRHKGIGGDGLVLIGAPSTPEADFSMRIFNADGSEAMMCGNASRCVGKYVYEKGLTRKTSVRLETLSGIKTLELHTAGRTVESVTVDMLAPRFDVPSQYAPALCDGGVGRLAAGGREFEGTFVSMGNPHFVIFTDDAQTLDISRYGSLLERHAAFPSRCNIEFAQVTGDGTIRTRVWERGSGITQACGTGACATAVAAALTGRSGRKCAIVMDGGTLHVTWDKATEHVFLTGGAEFVFEGEKVRR